MTSRLHLTIYLLNISTVESDEADAIVGGILCLLIACTSANLLI